MKKSLASLEVTRFNRAAFRVDAGAVREDRLEQLLDEALSRVLGSNETCTEFVCNVYAPPPPPKS